jgi:hypothetical protein
MGNDKAYVYGQSNGAEYDEISHFDDGHGLSGKEITKRTHWDPRIEVTGFDFGAVQVGVVPPSEKSTDEQGLYDSDNGQFLSLDRSGLNRLIEALQEAGAAVFGRDRW